MLAIFFLWQLLYQVNISSLNPSLFPSHRVPTRVSCDVTSENLRNVYNKEYLQPLQAICNQSCTILSICEIVSSSSPFLWASEGAIFFALLGMFFFFLRELIGPLLTGDFFSENN